MRTEFDVRPAEKLMMNFYNNDDLENACILKAKESNMELWIMLREDSCIFARMDNMFVKQLSYFAVQSDEDFESYNELINKLKTGSMDKSLADTVIDILGGHDIGSSSEFLS